jgi:aminomethyltransferase
MKTPLYNKHLFLNARMAPFGEWEMPIQYSGIIDEHNHTRQNASIFDICHMGEFIISGQTALNDLNRTLTANIATLKTNRCRYSFMLNENGGIIDDLIVYKLDDEKFMLVVNSAPTAGDAEWIQDHLSTETIFENISEITAKIDLQGPESHEILQKLTPTNIAELKYFSFTETTVDDVNAIISRTGYTGEPGYELYIPSDSAEQIWDKLLEDENVRPAGLGARDTLRLEAGLPLYGHELSLERNPGETCFMFAVKLDKEFIGKSVVLKTTENGAKEKLVGLKLPGRQSPRAHQKIVNPTDTDEIIGEVTSGSFAPTLGYSIAFAYIKSDYKSPGNEVFIDTGRKKLTAEVVKTPFYTNHHSEIDLFLAFCTSKIIN